GACFAQLPLSIGVKAGVPITDSFNNTTLLPGIDTSAGSKNYIVGPMVELRLPFALSVEADGLYRPLSYTVPTSASILSGTNLITVTGGASIAPGEHTYSTWEFPVLAKYRFPFPVARPYIEVGPSFRATSSAISYLSGHGITVGAGLDVHALLIHVAPEFRYTHWGDDSAPAAGQTYIQSKQDQVEFLVGFSF
ncbi:MAG TPA: hypothetical protein VF023_03190, partial [Bryobacteraceae bacterium]